MSKYVKHEERLADYVDEADAMRAKYKRYKKALKKIANYELTGSSIMGFFLMQDIADDALGRSDEFYTKKQKKK